MSNNYCHCGAQQGYPHHKHCPFPLFNDKEALVLVWKEEFQLNKQVEHIMKTKR